MAEVLDDKRTVVSTLVLDVGVITEKPAESESRERFMMPSSRAGWLGAQCMPSSYPVSQSDVKPENEREACHSLTIARTRRCVERSSAEYSIRCTDVKSDKAAR